MSCQRKWKKRSHETTVNDHIPFLNDHSNIDTVLVGTSMFERFKYVDYALNAWNDVIDQSKTVFNCSVGGDRICNILYRLKDQNILNCIQNQPQKFILMCGANDIEKEKIHIMINGVEQIMGIIKSKFPSTKLIIFGMYPRKSDKISPETLLIKVNDFNEKLKNLTDKLNVDFYNFGNDVLNKGLIDPQFFDDNVHFNDKGYKLFAKRLAQFV